jgi:hypothetical protein
MILGIVSIVLFVISMVILIYIENEPYSRPDTEIIGYLLFLLGFIGTTFFIFTNFSIIISWFKI